MKRILCICLSMILILSAFSLSASALEDLTSVYGEESTSDYRMFVFIKAGTISVFEENSPDSFPFSLILSLKINVPNRSKTCSGLLF